MRRISDALDAPGGIDADEDLRALLAADAEAQVYAKDVEAIDGALSALGEGIETDWDALADRIEASLELDTALDDIGDVTLPPSFEADDPAAVEAAPAVAAAQATTAELAESNAPVFPAPPAASTPAAEVIDLATRRRRTLRATMAGLAAAAAVGVGVVVGINALGPNADMMMSEAPAAQSPEPMMALAEAEEESVAEEPAEESAADLAEATAEAEPPSPAPMPSPAAAAPTPSRTSAGAPVASRRARAVWDQRAVSATPRAQRADLDAFRGRGGGGGAPATPPAEEALGGGAGSGTATTTATTTPGGGAIRPLAMQALARVEARVLHCMGDERAVARVTVEVAPRGQVLSARVDPPFTGATAACIERAVRSARMPVSDARYVIAYRFRPQPAAGGSLGDTSGSAARHRRMRRSAPAAAAESIVEP